jgi:hypothetical protein
MAHYENPGIEEIIIPFADCSIVQHGPPYGTIRGKIGVGRARAG